MNTLFNLPETHLIASLVDYYDRYADLFLHVTRMSNFSDNFFSLRREDAEKLSTGWRIGEKELSFRALFQVIS
jgi:hypothetical protein